MSCILRDILRDILKDFQPYKCSKLNLIRYRKNKDMELVIPVFISTFIFVILLTAYGERQK